jgi:hypothetical protein
MSAGMPLQVQTPSGLMQVSIPEGFGPGMSFEMMVPVQQQQQAPPVAQPMQPMYGQPPMMQQQQPMMQQQQPMMQQQQPMMQQQQQPNVVVVQQPPQQVIVAGGGYDYGGYGYGPDPGLAMMGGFVGGMIAGEIMDECFD